MGAQYRVYHLYFADVVSIFFFFFPRLFSAIADCMYTILHTPRDTAVTCAKTSAEPILMPSALLAQTGPRNHELNGGADPPQKGAILGKRVAHCKVLRLSAVSCAKTAELIDLPFGLWNRVGRRKYKFHRIRQMVSMCPRHSAMSCAKTAMRSYVKYFDHLSLVRIAVGYYVRSRADYCCRPSSVVCRSVCHTSEPCKNGWTDRCCLCWGLGWALGTMY